MGDAKTFLVDWSLSFVKHRDLMLKKIINIEDNKEGADFLVHFKDKDQYFIASEELNEVIISKIKEDLFFGIVVFNTKKSFDFTLKNWELLSKFRKLTIYYINPFTNPESKWILQPYTHNNIAEKSALRRGLQSIYEGVISLSKDEIDKNINKM